VRFGGHVDADLAEDLGHHVVGGRRKDSGGGESGGAGDQTSHGGGRDGNGGHPEATTGWGSVEHSGTESGSNLTLPAELRNLGWSGGGGDEGRQASPLGSEEGDDVAHRAGGGCRPFDLWAEVAGHEVLTTHIRNPTLRVHEPLHHHFVGLGFHLRSQAIGNDSLQGMSQTAKTSVTQDPDRARGTPHDLRDGGDREPGHGP
jgi:hypothetical protein